MNTFLIIGLLSILGSLITMKIWGEDDPNTTLNTIASFILGVGISISVLSFAL